MDLELHDHRLASRDVRVRQRQLRLSSSDDVPFCIGADSDLCSVVVFRDSIAPMKKVLIQSVQTRPTSRPV